MEKRWNPKTAKFEFIREHNPGLSVINVKELTQRIQDLEFRNNYLEAERTTVTEMKEHTKKLQQENERLLKANEHLTLKINNMTEEITERERSEQLEFLETKTLEERVKILEERMDDLENVLRER